MWIVIQHIDNVGDDADQPPSMTRKQCRPESGDYDSMRQVILYPFRLKDADGNVYCIGLSSDDSSFAPLDDYGRGAFGCTDIEYFDRSQYEWVGL